MSGKQPLHAKPGAAPPSFRWSSADVVAAAALAAIVAVGWCAAHGLRSPGDLGLPVGHLASGPDAGAVAEYNDLYFTLALSRAAGEGRVIPVLPKRIPQLGAPAEADWSDWPLIEEPQMLLTGLLGRLCGPFAALNLSLLLGHVLAAVTMYAVATGGGAARPWAFLAGAAYGLAPFLFAQSPHHATVAWAWHVPLFIPAWRWAADPAIGPRDRRFLAAAAIGALAGVQNPYYTNILCQLAILSAAATAWRTRSWSAPRTAGVIVLAAAVAFGLMHLDTLLHGLMAGRNPAIVQREYKWMEIYGLKLVDLVVPSAGHRVAWMERAGAAHRAAAPLLDEGASYLGVVGIGCLAWLAAVSVAALVERHAERVPVAFWQVAWIVLVFTTGGLNAFAGSAGFLLFRAGCRASIAILAIVLEWGAVRATALVKPTVRGTWGAAALAAAFVFLDQVPRGPAPRQLDEIAARLASERTFLARLEEALPEGAMVLQLPLMDFPESPGAGLGAYDQLRPYALGSRLRWSFGTVKGRPRDEAMRVLEGNDIRRIVTGMRKAGFAAIVVHRAAFPDRGRELETLLRAATGGRTLIESPAGDVSCVVLGEGG